MSNLAVVYSKQTCFFTAIFDNLYEISIVKNLFCIGNLGG